MDIQKIKSHINPKRILDIGANVGQFHQICKNTFPDAYVFSIEASNECEHYLKQVAQNYKIAVLSDSVKEVNFYKNRNNLICTGDSIYRELTEHYNDTSVLIQRRVTETLDDIFPNGTEFDLIKLDTQGSEIDIIKGGQILCKKSKLILMEVSIEKYNQDSPLYDEVIAFMHSINFEKIDELEDHFLNGKLIQKDILFINKSL